MVTEDDAPALVLRVFASYLTLMRRVQTTYWCAAPVKSCICRMTPGSLSAISDMSFTQQVQQRHSSVHPISRVSRQFFKHP